MLLTYEVGEWLCWKSFHFFMPFFLSSASPSHSFGYHLLSLTLFHYRLYLSLISFLFLSFSSDISYGPSSASPWGQIATVVTPLPLKQNKTVEFNSVALHCWPMSGAMCTKAHSVTAWEAGSCLGYKPVNTFAFTVLLSGFKSQSSSHQISFVGKGDVKHLRGDSEWNWPPLLRMIPGHKITKVKVPFQLVKNSVAWQPVF